jgi:hypothetical protein
MALVLVMTCRLSSDHWAMVLVAFRRVVLNELRRLR